MGNTVWKIGAALGVLGGMAGIVAAIWVEPVAGSLMALLFVGVFGAVWLIFLRPMFRNANLKKTGIPARGKVLKVWDTGVTVNNNPQIGMELEVETDDLSPWIAKTKLIISRLQPHIYQPGATVQVRYDPKDPERVAVVGLGEAVAPVDLGELENKLREIDRFNEQLNRSGDLASAIVMEAIPMGINVNGDNPAMTLKVKVMPRGEDPFDSELAGVFSSAGLHKYQPGKEIEVRYDRWAKDRVTVAR